MYARYAREALASATILACGFIALLVMSVYRGSFPGMAAALGIGVWSISLYRLHFFWRRLEHRDWGTSNVPANKVLMELGAVFPSQLLSSAVTKGTLARADRINREKERFLKRDWPLVQRCMSRAAESGQGSCHVRTWWGYPVCFTDGAAEVLLGMGIYTSSWGGCYISWPYNNAKADL